MRKFFIKLIGNKKRKEEIDTKKIKYILTPGGRIGDIIAKTPYLRALSNLNDDVKIDILVFKGCESLIENAPYINKIFTTENKKYKNKILRAISELNFAFKMRNKYDLFIDFSDNPRFLHILSLRILNPKYLIGLDRNEKFGLKKDELTIFNKYISVKPNSHISDLYLDSLNGFGLDLSNKKYELFLGELENKFSNFFDKNKFNIIFNFVGSSPKKSLNESDIDFFIKNIPNLHKNIELHILTIPPIYDKIKIKLENLNIKNVKLLPKTNSILEAAAIIKFSDFLFSVDTGVIHIASTYNIPLLSLHENTKGSYITFAPKSDISKVIICEKKDHLILKDKNFILTELKDMLTPLFDKSIEQINKI